VSSAVRRARETAEIVSDVLGLSPEVDEDWREIDVGAWEGRTADRVRRAPAQQGQRTDGGSVLHPSAATNAS
jgi:broad specificity phosphatase PhoE